MYVEGKSTEGVAELLLGRVRCQQKIIEVQSEILSDLGYDLDEVAIAAGVDLKETPPLW